MTVAAEPGTAGGQGALLRGVVAWGIVLVLANVNGAFRELVLRRALGDTAARAASTLLLCGLVVFAARATIRWIAPTGAGQALHIGLLWLALTLGFEFLAGHYLFGTSWEEIMREYDVTAGRLWILVPIATLLAPRWAWRRLHRKGAGTATLLTLVAVLSAGCSSPDQDASPAGGASADDTPAASPATGSPTWTVRPDGAGPVAYGMTIAEAETAVGESLAARPDSGACTVGAFRDMPEGMQFMIEHGRIVRTDITTGTHATDRGARIGMAVPEVQSLYGGTLAVRPHKYDSAGSYLVYAPEGAESLRVIFEASGGAVTRYRAGILPAVEYVEGCG
jgi:hypothetical protein